MPADTRLARTLHPAPSTLPTHYEQDVIDGYLLPLQAPDWDRGALLNLRAFSLPPAYDYNALTAPVALVVGSEDGALTEAARGLEGLLRARPAGATRFAELQVWRGGRGASCWVLGGGAPLACRAGGGGGIPRSRRSWRPFTDRLKLAD